MSALRGAEIHTTGMSTSQRFELISYSCDISPKLHRSKHANYTMKKIRGEPVGVERLLLM